MLKQNKIYEDIDRQNKYCHNEIVKQKLFLHFVLILLFSFIVVGVKASTQSMMIMPPDTEPSGVFGEDHYYSVIFRGNGDAVVNLKAIFTNTEEATVSAVTLRAPKGQVEDIVAYQLIKDRRCLRYGPTDTTPKPGIVEDRYDPPVCIQYENPDFYGYTYSNNTKYRKAEVKTEGELITITLPEGVSPEVSASYILYYRSKAYTQKDFAGAYSYSFETLKTESPIRNLQVGVSTDSNLKLKDASSDVNYAENDTAISELKMAPAMNSAGMTSQAFDRYYQQIGQGSIVEHASSLQPLDTFTVEGVYAKSVWQLHAKTIIIVVVIGLIVIVGIGFGLFKLFKYIRKKSVRTENSIVHAHTHKVLWLVGGSFGASVLTAGYTIFLFFISSFVSGFFYIGYQFNLLLSLFLLILSLAIYPLCLFVPAIVMGVKKGLWWGVGMFAMTIGWLMVYLLIVFGFLVMTSMNDRYPRPMPYIYGTSDSVAPRTLEAE